MRCVGRVAAALIFAAAVSATASRAWDGAGQATPDQARLLIFTSTDFWRHGGFAHGGVLWAPAGLDREGLVLKVAFGGGLYRYISGALGNAEVRGRTLSASMLPGYRFVRPGLYVTVFAGLDAQRHRLSPYDPTAGLRGGYFGFRTGFEFWHEPDAMSMVAADASISTIGPSYSARLAAGWRLFDWFYLGPEVGGFAADDNYRQIRAGMHVTGFRTETLEWSAALGFARDSDDRSSAYGRIGVFTRR